MPLALLPDSITAQTEHGEAIVLRRPVAADVPALIDACQDPEIPRWTTVPSPYGGVEAQAFIDHADSCWRGGELQRNYLVSSETNELLGVCGLVRAREDDECAEVGYWMAASARSRGIGLSTVCALTKAIFHAGYHRVDAKVLDGNIASRRLLERAGFVHEGVLRSIGWHGSGDGRKRIDIHMYSLLPTDPGAIVLLGQHPYATHDQDDGR